MMTHKIIRLPTVKELTGLSTSSIWRREHEGDFPRRLALGKQAVGWHYDEVLKWLDSRRQKTL